MPGMFLGCGSNLAGEEGETTLEFALVCIAVLTLMFGIMDFSRLMYCYHFVSEVAREGTRYAMVRGQTFNGTSCSASQLADCDASSSNLQSYVSGLMPTGMVAANLTVTPSWPGAAISGTTGTCPSTKDNNGNVNSPGCPVSVQVSYKFNFMLPFLPSSLTTYTLTSTSEVIIQE